MKAIIAVHGVGDARRGELLDRIVEGVQKSQPDGRPIAFCETAYVADGHRYPGIRSLDGSFPDIFEANWSDIRRPDRSAFGALLHLLRLAYGIPTAKFEWLIGIQSVFSGLMCFIIQAVFAWVLYPVLIGLLHVVLRERHIQLVVAEIAVFAMAFGTFFFTRNWTKLLRYSGIIWLSAIFLSIIVLHQISTQEFVFAFSFCSASIYGGAQVVSAALATLIVGEIVAKRYTNPELCSRKVALAYVATSYGPLLILSMLGACVWAAVLNILNLLTPNFQQQMQDFQSVFLKGIRYDLALVEWTLAGVFVLIAAVVSAAAVRYTFSKDGKTAHNAVGLLLWLTPAMLIVPVVALITTYIFSQNVSGERDIFLIYTWSALRIGPWLLLVAAPTAIVLDTIGDVALYILPEKGDSANSENMIGTRCLCKKRLERLLCSLSTNQIYDGICVLAHSQGSVISYDVLKSHESAVPISFVSVGSPISTLYVKFLQWDVSPLTIPWSNCFRHGDYIGGSIPVADDDACIGPGGHTNYWSEPALAELMCSTIEEMSKEESRKEFRGTSES